MKELISRDCYVNFDLDKQCARCQSLLKPMTIYYVYEFKEDGSFTTEYVCSKCENNELGEFIDV